MFTGLKTDSLPVSRLLCDPFAFTVPAYQRGYAWTTREVGQLLDDVTSAAGVEDPLAGCPDYFLGTVLLLDPSGDPTREDSDGLPARLDLVDGQQRLVTLTLLAAVLCDVIDDAALAHRLRGVLQRGPDGAPRVLLCEDEQPFYQACVLDGAILEDETAQGEGASTPLATAHEYLRQEITALSAADRQVLARYLLDCCHVVTIITRDIDRAHLLFTVLNDRGRPLQRKDILKVEVLKDIAPEQADDALARWDAASAKLGNDFESLFSHIRSIHSVGRPQIISAMRAIVRQAGSEHFLSGILTPMADSFHLIRRFGEVDRRRQDYPDLAAALISLNRFGNTDWVAPAMLAMNRFADHPVWATRIVMEIDRLNFLLKVLSLGGARRNRRMSQVIAALSGDVAHEIDAAFEITREEARAIVHHLKDIHRRNPGLAKLILMRIEDELAGAPLLLSTSELSVEHVLPQRPSANSPWRRSFPDGDVRETCRNSIGNLTLVTPRMNERMRNKEFAEKHALLASAAARGDPQLRSNDDILDASEWTERQVMARERRLLGILGRLWRIDGLPPAEPVGERLPAVDGITLPRLPL